VRKREFEVTLRKKMEKLEQIKVIASNLKTGSAKAVRALHRFVFEQEGNRNNRKRLREFEGFSFASGSEEHRAKLAYVDASLGWGDLVSICNVLAVDYSGTKKELSQRICNCLMDLNLLNEVNKEGKDEENDNDDEINENDDDVKEGEEVGRE